MRLLKKWSSKWLVDDVLMKMSNQNCPILPSGYDPDSQVINLFPRLVETIEPNTARHREVCKQRASHVNKVLGGWLEQLGGTQYRYVCTCPALHCTNKIEFYSFKEPTEITYDETPKCEACSRGEK